MARLLLNVVSATKGINIPPERCIGQVKSGVSCQDAINAHVKRFGDIEILAWESITEFRCRAKFRPTDDEWPTGAEMTGVFTIAGGTRRL